MKEPDSEERNAVRVILNDVKESPSCDHGNNGARFKISARNLIFFSYLRTYVVI